MHFLKSQRPREEVTFSLWKNEWIYVPETVLLGEGPRKCVIEMRKGQVRSNPTHFCVDQVTLHLCQFCHWQKQPLLCLKLSNLRINESTDNITVKRFFFFLNLPSRKLGGNNFNTSPQVSQNWSFLQCVILPPLVTNCSFLGLTTNSIWAFHC